MFVRFGKELIDLRLVKEVVALEDEKSYEIHYKNNTKQTIVLEGVNPDESVNLANAMITIFDNIVDND